MENNLTALLIAAITTLAAAIGVLFKYITKQNKQTGKQSQQYIENLNNVIEKNAQLLNAIKRSYNSLNEKNKQMMELLKEKESKSDYKSNKLTELIYSIQSDIKQLKILINERK